MQAADPEALYRVLCHSYSSSAEERRQAEAFLEGADRSPGFPAALLRVAVEHRAEASVRLAAAIQLKNQVRRWWSPVGDNYGKGYGDGDKASVRNGILEGIAAASAAPGVQAQLVESFRLIALQDFPNGWPGLVEKLVAGLRSDDTIQTYCALLLIRKLYKQLEMRPTSRRGDLESLIAQTLPTLRTLAPALAPIASQLGPHSLKAFDMIKVILKCFYSASYMAVDENLQRDIDAWMALVLSAAELPKAIPAGSTENREVSQDAKCRKWIFHIFFRFCHRHGNRRRCVNGSEGFAEAWASKYAPSVTQACLREVCTPRSGEQPSSKRSTCLALLCLGELCTKDATYAIMRPSLQQVLEVGIFSWARFGTEDMRLWQEDPEEFVRQSFDDMTSMHVPRAAAVELVERLLKYRRTEVLMPLLQFCRQHLDAQMQNPSDPTLCANKDGALLLLGSMGDELLRLDPTQQKKPKKPKGRASRGVQASGVSLEELLTNYVRPAMASQAAFLRLRACWVYEQLAARAARLGPPGATAEVCRVVMHLAGDPELPVRVRACTCLQAFARRRADGEVRAAIVESLGPMLERLLRTMTEVQCEEIAATLEALVSNFPQEIVPFAAQLVAQLSAQVCQIAGGSGAMGQDDEDDGAENMAMGSLHTVISVLQACAVVRDPQDLAERQRQAQLFAAVTESLLPMLGRLLHPDGIDFLEEALELLTYVTYYGPSPLPASLWLLFPRLYQAVCGHSTASLPLPATLQEGWAPDFMANLLPPLENYIIRGPPETFMAGTWAEAGAPYPEMIFGIFKKVVHMSGIGSEQDCACAVKLSSTIFTSVPAPAADAWLPRYFDELWLRLPKAETAVLRRCIFSAFATMLWYNPQLLLSHAEQRGCMQQLFQMWMSRIGLAKRLADRKVIVLGFLRLFQLGCSQSLPASLMSGLPNLMQQLVAQSREVIKLRAKREHGDDDSDCAESDDDESEEADEDQLNRVLRKLEQTPDIGEDEVAGDDDDDDEDDLYDDAARRGGRGMVERASLLDKADEVVQLAQALRQAPPQMQQQVQGWIGAPLEQWLAELDAEEKRSAAATLTGAM